MFHLLIFLENISWTLLQLLNVDHGFCTGNLMSWQKVVIVLLLTTL